MGLKLDDDAIEHGEARKTFSQDVLKIEFSDPEHEHFSVLDLPGLFRSRLLLHD